MFDNFYCNLLKKKKNCSNKCTFSEHLSCKCHAYEYGIWMYHCTVFVRSAAESLFYWQWLSSSAGSIIYRFAQVDNAMRSFWRMNSSFVIWDTLGTSDKAVSSSLWLWTHILFPSCCWLVYHNVNHLCPCASRIKIDLENGTFLLAKYYCSI